MISDALANVVVVVDGHPNVGFLLVLDLDTVWVAFVPTLQDSTLGEFTDVGVDGVANLESEVFRLASHEAAEGRRGRGRDR